MTPIEWVAVCGLVATALLVGIGFLAFWPTWPPLEPGVHRAKPKPEPEPQDHPLPLGPTAEEWMWTTEEARRTRARHRAEDHEGTQPLRWHERPSGPQPIYPPRPPVQ